MSKVLARSSTGWAGIQAVAIAGSLIFSPPAFAAEEHAHHAAEATSPAWAEQLKGQTVVENAIEGRPDRAVKVDLQHQRLMRQIESQAQSTSGGFNTMSAMHQYAGQDGASFLLASDNKAEPVATGGGRCPSSATLKKYDVSMIAIEITLNQWLDYYPGYMYILTENIEKARAEEARNNAARENEKAPFDPGAVSTGLQGDIIQPLVIRGNQGDCVKITLRNQIKDESGSLHIHGASMIVSSTGKAAITTNPDTVLAPGKSVEMEWYIHPNTQEGVRQFHSYSNDRERSEEHTSEIQS